MAIKQYDKFLKVSDKQINTKVKEKLSFHLRVY